MRCVLNSIHIDIDVRILYKNDGNKLLDDHSGEEIALLELVRSHPVIGSRRMSRDKCGGNKINNAKCYKAIAEAMVKYADSYPAPSSFKKRMREKFVRWLEAIRSKYEFPEQPEIPWGLYPEDGEKDTVVGMLQSLQFRRGVTKEELQVRLGIGPRAILKDLCKLDPTLREDGTEEQETPVPFYIGGQPVRARRTCIFCITSIRRSGIFRMIRKWRNGNAQETPSPSLSYRKRTCRFTAEV